MRMSDADTNRCKPGAGYFPADANQRYHPEFDLMSIGRPVNIRVLNLDNHISIRPHLQVNAFIRNRAVALGVAKGIGEVLRRCHDVIRKTNFAQIEFARQMKSKKIVADCLCC
jgi:hypothetical protein